MVKLNAALEVFGNVKQSGANGEKLAIATLQVHNTITEIITIFEAGIVDPAWTGSVIHIGGQETLDYAASIYTILKETQAKLDALG